MQARQTPSRIPVPFALNGKRNPIPEASQISVTPGAASFNDGFPPLTMTDPLQGGIPPFGKDINGVLYMLSAIAQWIQAGGGYAYDPTFCRHPNIGGYPKGAKLLKADLSGFWFNTADHNETNPDATDGSAQNWVPLNADWNASNGPGQILNRPSLANVATSGSYNDLKDKPAIPGGQVNADWNATSGVAQILNKPTILSNLPTLIIDVGNDAQPNDGRGIDRDKYYQLDFHSGTTAYNDFPYVVNSDGTFTVAPGLYLVTGCLQIVASVADTYQLPAQMTFATGRFYRWPGRVHDGIQAVPGPPTATQSVQGSLGMIVISGVQKWDVDWEVWMGFSKILGTTSQEPLKLLGGLSVTQLSASWPGIKMWPDMARRAGER